MKAETEFGEGLGRPALGWALLGSKRDIGEGGGVAGSGEATRQGGHGIQERAHPGLDVDLVGELGVG